MAVALALSGCLEQTPGYQGTDSAGTGGTGKTTAPDSDGTSATHTSSDTGGGSGDGETSSGGGTGSSGTGSSGTGSSGTGSSGSGSGGSGAGLIFVHLIFVTSASYAADHGGLQAADGICQTHADGGGLPGTFVALLSSATVAARDRVTVTGTIVNMAGQIIAVDEADLWDGTLQNAVDFDENGDDGPGVTWTGTLADGSIGETCQDWTSTDNALYGTQGNVRMTDAFWVESPDRCFKTKRLYCISQ
jgi:hypothetical protein